MKKMTCWVGPVHSEKTTGALLIAKRYMRLGHDVALLRPKRSVRPQMIGPELGDRMGMLVTESGHSFPSLEADVVSQLAVLVSTHPQVIWIDEPMLFEDEEEVFDQVQEARRRAIILVSGLSMTSELEVFGTSMARLMAVADEVIWCKADCDVCKSIGTASRSICRVRKDGQIKVGGTETYLAACPRCWRKNAEATHAVTAAAGAGR